METSNTKEMLSSKLAAQYLKEQRKPKRTQVHFKLSKDERTLLEEAARREGVNLSEAARRLTFKSLHSWDIEASSKAIHNPSI